MLMAAMRLNIPAIFVSGGPMEAGRIKGKERGYDLVDAMVLAGDDSVTDAEIEEVERCACPTCGSCSGMFTANSMNCLNEALGLALPGGFTWATFFEGGGFFIHEDWITNAMVVFQAVTLVNVLFVGYEVIATTAEEARNPGRNIPIAVVGTIFICAVVYCAVAFAALGIIPASDLGASSTPLSTAASRFLGSWGAPVMGLAGLIGNGDAIGETFQITSDFVLTWNQIMLETCRALGVDEPDIVHIPTDFICSAAPVMDAKLVDWDNI